MRHAAGRLASSATDLARYCQGVWSCGSVAALDEAAGAIDLKRLRDSAVPHPTARPAARPSVLPVQGPPGSGKTFTGARMILDLLVAGMRIGVTANSHKVISNRLAAVCAAA